MRHALLVLFTVRLPGERAIASGGGLKRSLLGLFVVLSAALICSGCGSSRSSGTAVNGNVTASISASPSTVDLGQSLELTWSSTNATSCLATSAPAEADWTAVIATNGSATVTPASYPGVVYSLTCAGSSEASATASTSVSVNIAIANATNNQNQPTNIWAAQSCEFDGQPISNVTILSGYENAYVGVGFENLSGENYGGVWGQWTATGDGTGLLIDYYTVNGQIPPQCYSVQLPASILNITGSTASGSFNADLVDQYGKSNSCSFVLVPNTFGEESICGTLGPQPLDSSSSRRASAGERGQLLRPGER